MKDDGTTMIGKNLSVPSSYSEAIKYKPVTIIRKHLKETHTEWLTGVKSK